MLNKLSNCDVYEKNNERSLRDIKTWQSVLYCVKNILNQHKNYIFKEIEYGFKKLSPHSIEIPTEKFINKKLSETGWKIYYVDGFISTYKFAELISNKVYPVNFAIRSSKNIFYSPEPDFVHDILGHVPMLFFEPFQRIMVLWAQKTLNNKPLAIDNLYYNCTLEIIKESKKDEKDQKKIKSLEQELTQIIQELHKNPTIIWKLGNFFDWSFEFGIIKDKNHFQIFGGAIITSHNEINSVIQNADKLEKITIDVIQQGINYAQSQKKYYYINNFQDYEKLLNSI